MTEEFHRPSRYIPHAIKTNTADTWDSEVGAARGACLDLTADEAGTTGKIVPEEVYVYVGTNDLHLVPRVDTDHPAQNGCQYVAGTVYAIKVHGMKYLHYKNATAGSNGTIEVTVLGHDA